MIIKTIKQFSLLALAAFFMLATVNVQAASLSEPSGGAPVINNYTRSFDENLSRILSGSVIKAELKNNAGNRVSASSKTNENSWSGEFVESVKQFLGLKSADNSLTATKDIQLLNLGGGDELQAPLADQTFSGGASGNNTAWLTTTNWVGGAFPGSQSLATNTDIATIPSTGTNPSIGINFNFTGNRFYLGAINFTGANRAIGDSSATAGNLQFNGATINAVSNVVLRNSGIGTLTLQATQSGIMGVTLGNTTDNIINIDGTGGITISSVISGTSRKLTKSGSGTGVLTLSGINTYTGDTTINAGTLSLGTSGSIATSPNIILAGGATFDVSTQTTALTLTNAQTLKASGTTTAGTIATAAGKGLTLGATSGLQFTAYNGVNAPLTISGAGNITLASGNQVTVTVVNGGTPLSAGDYTLISKGTSSGVTGTVPTSVTVNGNGIVNGATASLQIVNSELILRIVAAQPGTIQFSSVSYTISEGGGTATFIVTRTNGSSGAVSATYMLADSSATGGAACATNGVDYINTGSGGSVSFADGDTADKTINIQICDDLIYEGDETFTATLSTPTGGANLGTTNPATMTIQNNDAAPTFSISDITMAEGNGAPMTFMFMITKDGSTQLSSTVNFATSDGTATTADSDYTATSGVLTFAAGENSMTVNVTVTGDMTTEPDEAFKVVLSGATGATIIDNTGFGNILNDETASTGTIPAGVYRNLNIGAAGATLGGDVIVTNALALGDGILMTGTNTVTLDVNATYTRSTGFVEGDQTLNSTVGGITKLFPAGNEQSFEFPVGTISGTDDGYTPVTLSILNTAISGNGLTVKAVDRVSPSITRANITRYWQLTKVGIGSITTNLTFTYLFGDQSTIPTENLNSLTVYRNNGSECAANSGCVNPATAQANGTGTVSNKSDFSPWGIGVDAPLAAEVSVSGRVTEMNGRGISRARVTMTDSEGVVRTAFTNQMGFYHFDNVPAGETYFFTAAHRRYRFGQPTQIHFIGSDEDSINFVSSGADGLINLAVPF